MIADALTGRLFCYMGGNNQQSNPYGALMDYIFNSGGRTAQNAQQILQGTGLQGTYNTQVALGNAATGDQQKQLDQITSGNVNGEPINPTNIAATNNQNMIKDSSMPVNLLLGILSQASAQVQNQNNNATSYANNSVNAANNAVSANANKTNAQTNAANSGWTVDSNGNITNNNQGSGATTGNPRIDTWTSAVMNGYKSISDLPSDIAPRVMQQLQKNGYDAAKPINTDIAALTNLYGLGGDTISQANNPSEALKGGLGSLLNLISGGTIQTQTEQKDKNYQDAANNFKSKYANILGKNIDLPTAKDSSQTAKDKISKLIKQVQAVYYNGGSGPTNRPSLDSFNQ